MQYKTFNAWQNGKYSSASLALTIGCNVGDVDTWTPAQVWEAALAHLTNRPDFYRVTRGEWEGIAETSVTVHIPLVFSFDFDELKAEVQELADALEQDAIGIWDNYGGSMLVWGTRRAEGREALQAA